jgi:L-ascorbate metabolism protein UlaG (beta-lactamase superfamily)
MKVKWLGHACFLLTSRDGLRIVTDPYIISGKIMYAPVTETADIVTVSHDHSDHNNVATVKGNPQVVKDGGVKMVKGIQFKGVQTYHDDAMGEKRGKNVVTCFTIDGIKICHLGDLGHALSTKEIADIGAVDVLLVPVGGFFTVDARVATQISDNLKPKVIFPMHYKTPKLDFPITGVEEFLTGKSNVKRVDDSEFELTVEKLPKTTEIIVLKPAH